MDLHDRVRFTFDRIDEDQEWELTIMHEQDTYAIRFARGRYPLASPIVWS